MRRTPASDPVEYTGSARQLDYYSLKRSRRFQCQCGWVGPFSDLLQEHFKELFDASCPTCGTMLAIVSYPTGDDVRRAARNGNREAQEQLGSDRRPTTKNTATLRKRQVARSTKEG